MKIKRYISYLLLLSMTGFMAFCHDAIADEISLQCRATFTRYYKEKNSGANGFLVFPILISGNKLRILNVLDIDEDEFLITRTNLGVISFGAQPSNQQDKWYAKGFRKGEINRIDGKLTFNIVVDGTGIFNLSGQCADFKALF
jgi:hypothetical protein